MDKLEEHIRKNREELDKYSPASGAWKKINHDIRKGNTPLQKWFSIAAIVIVILGTSIVLVRRGNLVSDDGIAVNKVAKENESTQLNESEIYYNNLLNSLYTEATPLLTANPEIQRELNTDISQLDSLCLEIRKDLKDNIANQEVVEALIQNYRLKIRLLEDMLSILKETENNPEKKKNYEL